MRPQIPGSTPCLRFDSVQCNPVSFIHPEWLVFKMASSLKKISQADYLDGMKSTSRWRQQEASEAKIGAMKWQEAEVRRETQMFFNGEHGHILSISPNVIVCRICLLGVFFAQWESTNAMTKLCLLFSPTANDERIGSLRIFLCLS